MKTRYKALFGVAGFAVVVLAAGAVWLSHDAECGAADPVAAGATRMKAIVYRCYGPPRVLRLEEIAKPVPADDEVLVKVHAASVNPLDWHYMRGVPYVMRFDSGIGAPADIRIGVDFSGTVESVGRKVSRFRPGDEVFGGRSGALGEYVSVRESRSIVPKPANVSFEQAAAVPVAAVTALQALRDEAKVRKGEKVLVNGASGGVGTFAVQIAKSLGAEVTAVCGTQNVERVRAIGADHVIDYRKEDFTGGAQRYDVIIDMVGNHSLLESRRALTPQGRFVIVGGPSEGRWIGPLTQPMAALALSPFVSQEFIPFFATLNPADLEVLRGLMQEGRLTSVLDRTYPLSDAAKAIAYVEEGHARGKVIVKID